MKWRTHERRWSGSRTANGTGSRTRNPERWDGWRITWRCFPAGPRICLPTESFDIAPGGKQVELPTAHNRKELLANFDKSATAARAALAKASDAELMKTWSLLANGETMFNMPRVAVLRGMIMNHMIHHRAELCVYFRLNDVPVPGLYGPSADEK